jgi:hypothetical protein
MVGWRLAWRVALLAALAACGVLVGLWAAPKDVTGCTKYGCTNQFPSWFWPVTCIGGLALLWLWCAWSLVIRPVRSGALRDGAYPAVPVPPTTDLAGLATMGGALSSAGAEGWYHDPFGVHEARWFSDGAPTTLVRDGAVESHDEPPGTGFGLPLVPVSGTPAGNGADLLRADSRRRRGVPGDGAFQAFGSSGGSFT